MFLGGLFIQAVAIALFMVGTSLAFWITGAVLAGVSSAVVWTSCLSIIIDTVELDRIGHFFGYVSLALSLAIFLGPVLGGILYESKGPRAVWGLCFGFVGVDAILRILLIESPRRAQTEVDVRSKVLRKPRTRTRRLAVLHLLKSPRLLCALWATVANATILSSFDASLTIHARDTFHWNSMAAGLLYIAFVIPGFLTPVVGHLADRHLGKTIATLGFSLSTVVLVCLRFVDHNSSAQKALLCSLLFFLGLFLGTQLPIWSAEVTHVVVNYETEHPGFFGRGGAVAQAEGLWYAAFSLGAACGPLWGGLIQGAAGWKTMSWTLALLSGLTVAPVLVFTDGPVFRCRSWTKNQDKPSAV